jgi:hypothetical protein
MFRGLLIDDWIHKFFYVIFVIAYNAYSDFYPKKEKKEEIFILYLELFIGIFEHGFSCK